MGSIGAACQPVNTPFGIGVELALFQPGAEAISGGCTIRSMGWDPDEPSEDRMSWPYRVRARGQRHRDAPVSDRERRVWLGIWVFLATLVLASLAYWLTR